MLNSWVSGNETLEYLDGYTGRWVGDFTIHSTATGYTESFSVEQRYWWEGTELKGLSVSETSKGIETAKSVTYTKEDKLFSVVTRGKIQESFHGVIHEAGIVWLPTDLKRVTDYQMRESFSLDGNKQLLLTEGFDSYVYQGGLAHIVYRGRMVKQADEGTSNVQRPTSNVE